MRFRIADARLLCYAFLHEPDRVALRRISFIEAEPRAAAIATEALAVDDLAKAEQDKTAETIARKMASRP